MEGEKPWFHFLGPDYPRPGFDEIKTGLLSRGNTTPNSAAFRDLEELIRLVVALAMGGDLQSGSFLAELLAFLWKSRADLSEANWYFRKEYPKLESARVATRKGSALRKLVHQIVAQAQTSRMFYRMPGVGDGSLPPGWFPLTKEQSMILPELSPLPDSIQKWNNTVVYPELRRIARQLQDHPEIGKLKKALDIKGNFQVSRLKPVARQIVARIAALPSPHFFPLIWEPSNGFVKDE